MARRQAVEADEFFETANRLKAEGKKVTASTLLDALGGGSLRTIYKLLEIWTEKQPVPVTKTTDAIPSSVMAGFVNAWRLASQEAEQQIQAAKEKASEEVGLAIRQFQDALDVIDKLETENEANANLIEDLKAKLTESEYLSRVAQEESAAHKAGVVQLQKLVEKQEKDLERLRIETEKTKQDAEKASVADRAQRDAALQQAAEQKGRVDSLTEQNEQLLERLTKPDDSKKGK